MNFWIMVLGEKVVHVTFVLQKKNKKNHPSKYNKKRKTKVLTSRRNSNQCVGEDTPVAD